MENALGSDALPPIRCRRFQSDSRFTRHVLTVASVTVMAGMALAILLRAAAESLGRRKGLGAGWSLGGMVTTLAAAFAVGAYMAGSMAVVQLNQLTAELPKASHYVRAFLRQYPWGDTVLQ